MLLALLWVGMSMGLTFILWPVLMMQLTSSRLVGLNPLVTPWHRRCILMAIAFVLQWVPRKVVTWCSAVLCLLKLAVLKLCRTQ